jgi:hypothetical protein
MMIPFDPTKPWSGSVIGSKPDTARQDDGAHRHHLPVRGPPRHYSNTTYHASPDSELGEPRMAAAP